MNFPLIKIEMRLHQWIVTQLCHQPTQGNWDIFQYHEIMFAGESKRCNFQKGNAFCDKKVDTLD